jgi:1,4-dihydroxy-2-naphthoate octaprenyltransferase
MLILYANEIPDRLPDALAAKRTLVVRFGKTTVVKGYVLFAALAYLSVIAGVAAGVVPWPAVAGLATIPLALKVARGLAAHYDQPYEIMPSLQNNIVLHLATGVLLIFGTLAGRLTS